MKLQLLGAFELVDGAGHHAAIALRRARALIAYLALRQRRAESREVLADLLWPERFKDQAQASLRQTLHALNAVFIADGRKLIAATRTEVALGDAVTECDAWTFDRLSSSARLSDLDEAGRLYLGPFADGLSVSAEPFHEWLLVQRARYEQAFEESQLRAAALASAGASAAQAAAILERLLQVLPHSHGAALALMRVHLAAGQSERAAIVYDGFARRLRLDLGQEPPQDLAATARLARLATPQRVTGESPIPHPASDRRCDNAQDRAPMLAVLPFHDARPAPGNMALAAALTEDVLVTLSRCRWFRVMSRSSVYRLAASDRGDVHDLVVRTGADYLVSGFLQERPEGDSLTVELARAATREILWSERYPLTPAGVPVCCGEICAAVVSALDPALTEIERQRFSRPTLASSASAAAYRNLVDGYCHYYAGRRDAALAAFAAAVEADPGYAHAHAMLGLATYFYAQMNRDTAWHDRLKEAERHALRALDFDEHEARAWQVLGTVFIWQGRNHEALDPLERAIQLNPSLGAASAARSFQALMAGAFERAKTLLQASMRLRIGDQMLGACLPAKALSDLHLGNAEQAADTAHWAARMQPRFWLARQTLCAALMRSGNDEAAIAQVAALRRDYTALSAREFAAWVPYVNASHAKPVAEALEAAGWR
jgi:DNA-binding SARP family transcriptional activator/TolB-like protein/Flp pilus assembly protein TadD